MKIENGEVGFMLGLIYNKLETKINMLLKQSNLTVRQSQILWYLETHQHKMITQKNLEIIFSVSHPTISRMVKELEKRHFIYTYFHLDDKRMKVVVLNYEYRESVFEKPKQAFEEVLLKGFTQEGEQQLKNYLSKIYQNISDTNLNIYTAREDATIKQKGEHKRND